jgi:hypothetical protein
MTAGTLDNRTLFNEGDTNTGWNTGAATTASFAEPTASIAVAYNEGQGSIYYTSATPIPSGQMVYVYSSVVATQASWELGYHGLFLGDGTNRVNFHQSGNDREVFKHFDGPVGWQCFLLDTDYASTLIAAGATRHTVIGGTAANLVSSIYGGTTVDEVGAYYITLSKALGGGVNCYCDIIRYGNNGITIVDGSVSNPATFLDVVEIDRSTTQNRKAHGIIREYTAGIYGCQGPLNFGSTTVASGARFYDDGVVLVYEDRDVLDDKFYFAINGHSSVINKFELYNSTISTAGPYVTFSANTGNLNTLVIDTVVFSELGNSMTFSDLPDASGHYINNCTFTGCGQIDPGITNFTNNTISNPVPSSIGGFYLDQSTGTALRMSDLTFNSGGGGHAIYIAESGYYTFTNFDYNDYGSTGTYDAVIFNNAGGPVTINISGGESPTYRNGTNASTTLIQNVTITVTVIDEAGNPVENAQVALYVGSTQIMNEDTTALGVATEDYGGSTPVAAVLRIRKGSSTDSPKYLPVSSTQTIGTDGLTVTITLIEDTNNNS